MPAMGRPKPGRIADHPLYDQDLHAWIEEDVGLLREGRLSEVDVIHLGDELEDMAKGEQRAFASRLGVLLAHLLKWQHQPERRGSSSINTIAEQRLQLDGLLEQGPSLARQLPSRIERAYRYGVKTAAKEIGIEESRFPDHYPYSENQILDPDFWPSN
jgi:hypothetical protein